ncbi:MULTISPECIES: hypothetical protein [Methanobacterium]|jgi:hypothetical protein|uniref:Uncharacterized protein n=1 Tax=Methanobacterium veterum TaxID=408577 RepID=A0A9E5DL44_9EURY|nr:MULTISPECIES: hypothetical protein [Methanobacterium]MCZ3371505.1 hypothetical protein [Methanobacterium veterum]
MNNDSKIILTIFLAAGLLIFIKGLNENLGIIDIITIFVTFIFFLTGFAFLTASVLTLISRISTILFKK